MSHQRTVYVIDRDMESRRSVTGHLAAIGAEAWPFQAASEFLEIVDHLMPACILLDMEGEAPSGIDLLRLVSAKRPGWPVVALTRRPEVEEAVAAMKLGALDYMEKPAGPQRLAAALIPAWAALERSIEESEARRSAQERLARLTPRELDIALALLGGRANKGVAHEFGISVRTVEMHRAHIMAKLGVKSLAEAAVLATQAGLAPLPMTPAIPRAPSEPPRPLMPQLAPPPPVRLQPLLPRRSFV
jgi:two-component system response regulator FixJ